MKPVAFSWPGWLLCALVLLLSGLLAWLWLAPPGPQQRVRWQPPEAIASDIQSLLPPMDPAPRHTPDSAGWLQRLHARPLFILSRRPQEDTQEAGPHEEVQDAWAQARLLGTFSGGADGPGAIVLYEGQPSRLLRGKDLGGWTLDSVEARAITLERAGTRRRLELVKAEVGAPPAPDGLAGPDGRVTPVPVVPRPPPGLRFEQEPPRRRR